MKKASFLQKVLPAVLVLLLPTQVGKFFWFPQAFIWGVRVDFLAPALYLTDILVLLIAFFYQEKRNWLKEWVFFLKKQPLWRLVFLFLFLFLNVAFSCRWGVALYRLLKIGEFIFLVYFFSREFCWPWLFYLAVSNFYVSLIGLAQFFKKSSLGGWFYYLGERRLTMTTPGVALQQVGRHLFLRPYATFSHPNSLAGFLLVSFFLIWFLREKVEKGKRFFLGLVFILSGLTLLLTFSGAAYLVLGLFFLFWLGHGRSRGDRRAIILAVLIVFFLFLFFRSGLIEKRSINERFFLMKNALQLIKAHLLFGVGLGNFIPAQQELSFSRGQYNFLQPVHNIYLLIASETGLIGLGLFLCFVFYLFKKSYPLSNIHYPLFIILFLGFFDHYWLTLQQNFLLAAVVVGITIKLSCSPIKRTVKRQAMEV